MIKLTSAALAALLLVQDDDLSRAALKGFKHPWEDFTTGSVVKVREISKRPELDAAGTLVLKDETTESVWTVDSMQGEKPVLKVVSGARESRIPFYLTPPNWARGRGERKGEETIAVGDVKYVCDVTVILLDEGKDASQVTTISKCPTAPYWAVRRRVETFVHGRRNTLEEELLVGANEKVVVGETEVLCQVVEVTIEAQGAAKTVKREWRSDQVPGRVVRREARYYQGTKEVESAATKLEVVSFKSKK